MLIFGDISKDASPEHHQVSVKQAKLKFLPDGRG